MLNLTASIKRIKVANRTVPFLSLTAMLVFLTAAQAYSMGSAKHKSPAASTTSMVCGSFSSAPGFDCTLAAQDYDSGLQPTSEQLFGTWILVGIDSNNNAPLNRHEVAYNPTGLLNEDGSTKANLSFTSSSDFNARPYVLANILNLGTVGQNSGPSQVVFSNNSATLPNGKLQISCRVMKADSTKMVCTETYTSQDCLGATYGDIVEIVSYIKPNPQPAPEPTDGAVKIWNMALGSSFKVLKDVTLQPSQFGNYSTFFMHGKGYDSDPVNPVRGVTDSLLITCSIQANSEVLKAEDSFMLSTIHATSIQPEGWPVESFTDLKLVQSSNSNNVITISCHQGTQCYWVLNPNNTTCPQLDRDVNIFALREALKGIFDIQAP